MKKMYEAKLVGIPGINGKSKFDTKIKHPQAELTEPGEKPNMFNGQLISTLKSPTGKKIKFKFFTNQGSEYILSETNECRRIKCEIHGKYEAGLHDWNQFAFFCSDVFE